MDDQNAVTRESMQGLLQHCGEEIGFYSECFGEPWEGVRSSIVDLQANLSQV